MWKLVGIRTGAYGGSPYESSYLTTNHKIKMSEENKKICEECAGRGYPASDYCEGCPLRKYRE